MLSDDRLKGWKAFADKPLKNSHIHRMAGTGGETLLDPSIGEFLSGLTSFVGSFCSFELLKQTVCFKTSEEQAKKKKKKKSKKGMN